MPGHRQAIRALVGLVALSLAAVGLGTSVAQAADPIVKPIVFPVDGSVTYTDTYGACRGTNCSRSHEGQDLMGRKMQPLLSAVDGTVFRVNYNNSVGNSVTIKAADGWTYHYLHVNNDRPGTDDGQATRAQAFPAEIVAGARVTKGQVVAFMGDSGNAEGTPPHLHFEIRQPPAPGGYIGAPINPYASLQAATIWSTFQHWELRRTPTPGPVEDVVTFGSSVGDKALLCDWDADGVDEAVIYRSGVWHLRTAVTSGPNQRQISFGTAADTPLCADVDGDAGDEPVLFRAGTWTMRSGFGANEGVAWTVRYGVGTNDRPVLGDWDANGKADLAILRDGSWLVRSSAAPTGSIVSTFPFGRLVTDVPVAGDWDADGDDDPGIFRAGEWFLRSAATAAGVNAPAFKFGNKTGDQPVVGVWTDPVRPGLGVFRPKS